MVRPLRSAGPPTRHPVAIARCPRRSRHSPNRGTEDWRWQVNDVTFSQDGRRLASIMWRVRGHGNTTHRTSVWAGVWGLHAGARRPPVPDRMRPEAGAGLALSRDGRD